MDRALMVRLAAEAAGIWAGRVIERALVRPGGGLALLGADSPALDLAPWPPQGWVAATGLRLTAYGGAPGEQRAELCQALGQKTLLAVRVLAGDRVVRLDLSAGSWLAVELLAAAGNIYLVDADGTVRLRLRSSSRPGGGLSPGDPWRPPRAPSQKIQAFDPVWETPSPAPREPGLEACAGGAGGDPLQPLGAADLVVRADGPGPEAAGFEPCALLGDAVLRRHLRQQRHARAAARLAAWRGLLAGEGRRLDRLARNLELEARQAADHPELRRQAEALLAALGRERREGLSLLVPDPYDAAGAPLAVVLRPGEGPRAAADRLFRRAGRLSRVARQTARKLDEVRARRLVLAELEAVAASLSRLQDLEAAERDAPCWLRRPSATGKAGRQPVETSRRQRRQQDPRARKVRRYALAEDCVVLVGGGAEANDYLTFRVASPHDFWLHAADYPGAHVVLRNPGRLQQPPEASLRRAAALAAYFSKAPRGGPVIVRWTQAKHVHKGRSLPPGAVLLPRARSLSVRAQGPPAAMPGA